MIVSVITAVYNNREFIEDCIRSVIGQTYKKINYIIIDGGSTDGSLEIIRKYRDNISELVSEPDKGIYDALNKGIRLAKGDIIGLLHSDDFYASSKVIETVVSCMAGNNTESCYGDLIYVRRNNSRDIIRYWKSKPYKEGMLQRGWMPPHPTFFVKKEIYDRYGSFNTYFRISADYELILRFLGKNKISAHYIPEVLIAMRMGGTSNRSLKNMFIKTAEDYRAWKVNNLKRRFYTIPFKNLSKIPQFLRKGLRINAERTAHGA